MKNKILIVGATGFLGHNFAKQCLKKNLKVTCLSRNKPNKKRYLKSVKYLFADISKKKQLSIKLNQNYDYIINFAGDVDHHGKNTFSSHFNGCKNLADIFKKKKFLNLFKLEAVLNMENSLHHTPKKNQK